MSKRSIFARSALIAAAGAVALTAGAASAQPYGQYGYNTPSYSYDPCKREQTGRGVVGALLGGAIGAAVGANAAARNNRQDGALLGGGVGAIAGAMVGNKSAACTGGQVPYSSSGSYYGGSSYGSYGGGYPQYSYGYGSGYAPRPGRYVERSYYGDGYDDAWAYGRRGERYRVARAAGPDGCTLAESPIYMPDGRTETRMVRVCRDSSGRYAVVD
ncbi:glycine zipper domain-containing protein [Phenylobacterium sp. J367]|uniref:glycine zipper domain-containing protein n=1 Tax=Phenylobacterium sp. J367 TaxID=2898435 RepID=UPI0021510313|nr:glycine zipper domain-containing protein [Phenylobacterium sp. J367]MCR5879970.1 hypothetical protein [Phenylobacterium sp. J367]